MATPTVPWPNEAAAARGARDLCGKETAGENRRSAGRRRGRGAGGAGMSYTKRYAIYGAAFGLCFPLMAIPIEALTRYGSIGALGKALGSPLIWIILSAPFFLGLFASFAGRRQDQIIALEAAKRAAFKRTASDIFTAAQTLLSTVSSFSSMTSETAASVRETTATMGQLGHTATQAALTAETVIGLAKSSQRSSEDGLSA